MKGKQRKFSQMPEVWHKKTGKTTAVVSASHHGETDASSRVSPLSNYLSTHGGFKYLTWNQRGENVYVNDGVENI